MHTHHYWQWGIMLAAMAVLLTVLAFIAVGVGIRNGVVAPPDMEVRLGAIRVVAYTSDVPECPWPAEETCYLDHTSYGQDFYTVWVRASTTEQTVLSGPVLSLPLGRRLTPDQRADPVVPIWNAREIGIV